MNSQVTTSSFFPNWGDHKGRQDWQNNKAPYMTEQNTSAAIGHKITKTYNEQMQKHNLRTVIGLKNNHREFKLVLQDPDHHSRFELFKYQEFLGSPSCFPSQSELNQNN